VSHVSAGTIQAPRNAAAPRRRPGLEPSDDVWQPRRPLSTKPGRRPNAFAFHPSTAGANRAER